MCYTKARCDGYYYSGVLNRYSKASRFFLNPMFIVYADSEVPETSGASPERFLKRFLKRYLLSPRLAREAANDVCSKYKSMLYRHIWYTGALHVSYIVPTEHTYRIWRLAMVGKTMPYVK